MTAVPMIAARCKRCYLIAAKYWKQLSWDGDEGGEWVASDPSTERACRCDPAPLLPEGDELAVLVARAHLNRHPSVQGRRAARLRTIDGDTTVTALVIRV